MFTWVGVQLDAILSTYLLSVVSRLMAGLAPIALAVMTLWVALYGWAVLRHEVAEPLQAFAWRAFKIGLILALALQSSLYISAVAETASGLAMGVAGTFVPAGVDPATITSPYALLDRFNDEASAQAADIMKEASLFRLDLLLAAALFSIGSVIFLCIALFVVTLSKLLLTFVIAVGPLFMLCLLWRATARFFDSWLSMVLNAIVLTWYAFFALGLSDFMGTSIFKAIHDGGGFLGATFNVLGEATRYCVLMILMAILCFQAPTLASALTGGAAVQHGVQAMQNVLTITRLRPAAPGRSAGALTAASPLMVAGALNAANGGGNGSGGNSNGQAGTGMPFRAGQATRTAAYKLAALRGRA